MKRFLLGLGLNLISGFLVSIPAKCDDVMIEFLGCDSEIVKFICADSRAIAEIARIPENERSLVDFRLLKEGATKSISNKDVAIRYDGENPPTSPTGSKFEEVIPEDEGKWRLFDVLVFPIDINKNWIRVSEPSYVDVFVFEFRFKKTDSDKGMAKVLILENGDILKIKSRKINADEIRYLENLK